jgi:hypothetical protein
MSFQPSRRKIAPDRRPRYPCGATNLASAPLARTVEEINQPRLPQPTGLV